VAAIHDELTEEGVLKEGRGSMIRGRRGRFGRLVVTQKRVVFLQSSSLLMGFGAIGGLLTVIVKPKKVGFEVSRSAVTGVARVKFGLNKNVLEVTAGDGDPVRFAVTPYEEWAAAIEGDPVSEASSGGSVSSPS
jgi:hypothetical protein